MGAQCEAAARVARAGSLGEHVLQDTEGSARPHNHTASFSNALPGEVQGGQCELLISNVHQKGEDTRQGGRFITLASYTRF